MTDQPQWWFCRETELPTTNIDIDRHGRRPPRITVAGEQIPVVPDSDGRTAIYSAADRWLAVHTGQPPVAGPWTPYRPHRDRTPTHESEGCS